MSFSPHAWFSFGRSLIAKFSFNRPLLPCSLFFCFCGLATAGCLETVGVASSENQAPYSVLESCGHFPFPPSVDQVMTPKLCVSNFSKFCFAFTSTLRHTFPPDHGWSPHLEALNRPMPFIFCYLKVPPPHPPPNLYNRGSNTRCVGDFLVTQTSCKAKFSLCRSG